MLRRNPSKLSKSDCDRAAISRSPLANEVGSGIRGYAENLSGERGIKVITSTISHQNFRKLVESAL